MDINGIEAEELGNGVLCTKVVPPVVYQIFSTARAEGDKPLWIGDVVLGRCKKYVFYPAGKNEGMDCDDLHEIFLLMVGLNEGGRA